MSLLYLYKFVYRIIENILIINPKLPLFCPQYPSITTKTPTKAPKNPLTHLPKQTPHWLTVNPVGHAAAQVKLFNTRPETHAVQLSIVGPKQKVQFVLHASQTPVADLGYERDGHT